MIDKTTLENFKQQLQQAKLAAKRDNDDITIIAVAKKFDEQAVTELYHQGQRHFGENYVQEAQTKYQLLKQTYPDIQLHLIGHLQSKKAADAVKIFDVIHSIDREKIAQAIAEESSKQNKNIKCFVQVNIGNEEQKSGVAIENCQTLVNKCREQFGLDVIGLMAIAPIGENPGPYFALMRKLRDECNLKHLSMGMSSDYETAVMFGADYIRIGSKLFGNRDQN